MIVDVDGKAMAAGVLQAAMKARKPGDRLTVTYKRRGGATGTATIVLKEDPSLEAVTVESTGRNADARSEGVPGRLAGIEDQEVSPAHLPVIVMFIIRPIAAGGRTRKKTWNETGLSP